MHIILTRKGDGLEIVVNTDAIKLLEPDSDGVSTHVVLGPDFVRVVNESGEKIAAIIGASQV